MHRLPEADVDELFSKRWSPRAFTAETVSEAQLASVFEAARWAPPCYSEQPWRFVYGRHDADRERIAALLAAGNRRWAAAALSLTLQADMLGLRTHLMAGFDAERACGALGVPEADYEPLARIAHEGRFRGAAGGEGAP